MPSHVDKCVGGRYIQGILPLFDLTKWRDAQTKNDYGKALLFVAKSRVGGEGTELEMNWILVARIIETRKVTDLF